MKSFSKAMSVRPTDAFLIIDVQNDFCDPAGTLQVPNGAEVVPVINQLSKRFPFAVLTQDWHPAGHKSFASAHGVEPFSTVQMPYGDQVAWPDHCVQNSFGAQFHPLLNGKNAYAVIRKGVNPLVDSYSAFYENDQTSKTGLSGYLTDRKVRRVFVAGLALDYCVRFTALDAVKDGFDAVVVVDACRGITPEGCEDAMKAFEAAGVETCLSQDLLEAA